MASLGDNDLTKRLLLASMLASGPSAPDTVLDRPEFGIDPETNSDRLAKETPSGMGKGEFRDFPFLRQDKESYGAGFRNISGDAGDIPSSDLDDEPDNEAQPVPKEGPYTPLINVPRNQNNGYHPGRPYQSELQGGPGSMLAMALAGGAPSPASSASAGLPPVPQPAPSHYAHLPGPPLLLPGAGDNGPPIPGVGQSNPSGGPLEAIKQMLGMGGAAPPATAPAAPAAPASASGASTPIAGQASDMAPQTPEQLEIFRARQGLRAQEQALTSQINSTGNADLAEQLAKQRAALAAHDMQLEQMYIGTLKQTRTLNESELTKAEKEAGGEWQVDAAGNRSIVGGTEADTTRALNDEEKAQVTAAGGNPIEWQVEDGKLIHSIGKPITTEMVAMADGTHQLINKETGELVGKPIGEPATGGMLTQAAIDERAERGWEGDQTAYTGLGYGKIGAANRAAIANREAEIMAEKGENPTAQIRNQVGLGGEKQGARTMGAMGARINTFAEEAKGTSEEALARSHDLPREAWVPIEKIIQGGESMTNDPRYVRLLAANNALANTYSKAVNPNGILTDEGKRQAFEILNVARSTEGYEAAVKQVLREMRIVQKSVGTSSATQLYGGQATPSVPGPEPAAPTPTPATKRRGVYVPGKGIQFQ